MEAVDTLPEIAKRFSCQSPDKAKREFLPIEKANTELCSPTKGCPNLDAQYPRFDLWGAMSLSRKSDDPNDFFPVPKLAIFDVADEKGVCKISLNQWDKDNNFGGWNVYERYGKKVDALFVRRQQDAQFIANSISIGLAALILIASVIVSCLVSDPIGLLVMIGWVPIFAVNCGIYSARKPLRNSTIYTLTARFKGLIPEPIHKKIARLRNDGCIIYLLTEAIWTGEKSLNPNYDPIVVAWKNNAAYLVDVFDLTPVESYIAKEFSAS